MKLEDKAKEFGIQQLPGEGSLTLATRYMKGGKKSVIGYIQLAAAEGDKDALTWIHVWNDLGEYERRTITLDDICAASGIKPSVILKAIVGVAFEANCDVANLVAASTHPDVVAASAKHALKKDGIEDRKLLLQHHGFVPTPKGTTINVGVSASANAQAASAVSADQSVPDFLVDAEAIDSTKTAIQKLIEGTAPDMSDLPWQTKSAEGVLVSKDGKDDE